MSTNMRPKSVINSKMSPDREPRGTSPSNQKGRGINRKTSPPGFSAQDSSHQKVQWSFASFEGSPTGGRTPPRVDEIARRGDLTNLIINYMPQDMMESELYDLFSNFGEIRKHKVVRHVDSGLSACYGFVEFISARQATAAVNALDGYQVRNKNLRVAYARPPGDLNRNSNLYISHLPAFMDEQRVRDLFSSYGPVMDVNVLRNKYTKRSRGVAFVRFEHYRDAEMARHNLDQHLLNGAYKPITVKYAERQAESHRTSNGLQFRFQQQPPYKRRQDQETRQEPKRSR
ncbi:sex-lethal homolog [Drosophila ficusphila]|uniref:sex-lethal homolog n=1 Tax=Drosophila ficusphila TaxID=30025 RepID=UPI0007E5E2C7|nr:sex-lethal homolog [Drosophila ficusphila]